MKRILITGGSGFVGANLVRRCLQSGHEVHLLVRPEFNPWRLEDILPYVRLWELRLEDFDAVDACLTRIDPQWVMHLAVYGAYPAQQNLQRMTSTNWLGTVNLVNACMAANIEAFVNTGSSSEYGLKDHPPTEDEYLEPNSLYAIHKAAATHYCQLAAQKYQLPVLTLRLYSVFGPYEEPTRLIPSMLIHGLRGSYPALAAPDIARDYVYVDDVVDAYLQAATRAEDAAGQVYNIGTGIQTTLADVARIVGDLLQVADEPQWGTLAPREWDTSTWVSDPRKARRQLGWESKYTFRQGVEEMIGWFSVHPKCRAYYEEQLQR